MQTAQHLSGALHAAQPRVLLVVPRARAKRCRNEFPQRRRCPVETRLRQYGPQWTRPYGETHSAQSIEILLHDLYDRLVILRAALVPFDTSNKVVVSLDHAELTLHLQALSFRRRAPIGEDLRLLELQSFFTLRELVHDVCDFLLQTEVILQATKRSEQRTAT